ncbi:MAG: hypothetical protein JSU81_11375 [Candidatus Coatesbacteria bacterium]|nr:MAG: hypothetical protein JSU81_11375 [Candidatus Coatesbacteria bacterium]
MAQDGKEETVTLVVSPFVKIVLAVIAVALCVIALRGLIAPEPLYAQAGSGTMDVHVKSLPSDIDVVVSPEWTAFPVEVEGAVEITD